MKLSVRIRQSHEGGFVAVCPSLPGCQGCGPTMEQAREKLDEAIRGYVAAVNDFVPATLLEEVVEA